MGEEKIRQADLFPIFLSTHFLFYSTFRLIA